MDHVLVGLRVLGIIVGIPGIVICYSIAFLLSLLANGLNTGSDLEEQLMHPVLIVLASAGFYGLVIYVLVAQPDFIFGA